MVSLYGVPIWTPYPSQLTGLVEGVHYQKLFRGKLVIAFWPPAKANSHLFEGADQGSVKTAGLAHPVGRQHGLNACGDGLRGRPVQVNLFILCPRFHR